MINRQKYTHVCFVSVTYALDSLLPSEWPEFYVNKDMKKKKYFIHIKQNMLMSDIYKRYVLFCS